MVGNGRRPRGTCGGTEFWLGAGLARPLGLAAAALLVMAWPCLADDRAGVRVTAVAGTPFGVGELSFPLDEKWAELWHCRAIGLAEASGRMLYPVMRHPTFLRQLASQLEGDLPAVPGRVSCWFLFVGDAPLRLTVTPEARGTVEVIPEPYRQARHQRMMRQWWNQIWGPLSERMQDHDRPRPVENYVAGMGLWRLGLDRNPARRDMAWGTFAELFGGLSRLRADAARSVAFAGAPEEHRMGPLPPAMNWHAVSLPYIKEVPLEEIATRVPRDCFYLHFGKYSNLLWLTRLLEAQGEELQRLATLNGFAGLAGERLRQQLAIRELPMADLLGDQLIADVALIGRDPFLADGATIGVILQVKNNLMGGILQAARREAVAKLKSRGATETTETIAGQQVSLIQTPDFRLRSYHAVDGPYHLISNSRALVASFLQLPSSGNALAELPDFRQARLELPYEGEDRMFFYSSPAFQRALSQPAYLIELQRRLLARAELELLEVAVLAAQSEARAGSAPPLDLSGDVVEQLRAAGLLPPHFGHRCDGSHPQWLQGTAVDSLRGARGTFLPIADVEITSASSGESAAYLAFAARHRGLNGGLDPLAARMRRFKVEEQEAWERLSIDVRIGPLRPGSAALWRGLLGGPSDRRIRPAENSLASAEVIVNGCWSPTGADVRLMLTVQDGPQVAPVYSTKIMDLLELARRLRLQLFVDPPAALREHRLWQPAGSEDERYWHGPLQLIARELNDHAVVALRPDLLQGLAQDMPLVPDSQPAQVRLQVGDLQHSSLADCVSALAAVRAMRGSLRNVQRFHTWSLLLGQAIETAPETVARLVDMQPVCPLDGSYALAADPASGLPHWRSTSWPAESLRPDRVPDYEPALLRTWHGLTAAAWCDAVAVNVRAELLVAFATPPPAGVPGLPFWGGRRSEARQESPAAPRKR